MGITGNGLDATYSQWADVPQILSQFATYCAAAAAVTPDSCSFAFASPAQPDPATRILDRINWIFGNLTERQYEAGDRLYSIFTVAGDMRYELEDPNGWGDFAYYLLDIENAILKNSSAETSVMSSRVRRSSDSTDEINTNLTIASYNAFGEPPGAETPFVWPATICLDANWDNIATEAEFVDYISQQIAESIPFAYSGIQEAFCISWPNLTAHNVENYRAPFPNSLANKILIIGDTNNPWASYSGALATYQYVGSQNANFLIHDGLGFGIFSDPNNCSYNSITEFFVNGNRALYFY